MERLMYARFGDLHWWPGDCPDEIFLGAILTQNTSWKNVEIALNELRDHECMSIGCLSGMSPNSIAKLIRSSGFHNQKAVRIRDISAKIKEAYGGLEEMKNLDRDEVAAFLGNCKGIGPETLSSIMLYALDFPEFVVDAYTLRILGRIGFSQSEFDTPSLSSLVVKSLDRDIERLKNLHGLFVELAKAYCRKSPVCINCPLEEMCAYNIAKKAEEMRK
jgi:endonuclease-3 related protein